MEGALFPYLIFLGEGSKIVTSPFCCYLDENKFRFFIMFNLLFMFQKEELGRLLINIFAVVPGGVVCFFSSYDYEQQVYKHWQATGIIDKMNARKKVSAS